YGGNYEKWNELFGELFPDARIHPSGHTEHSPSSQVIENEVAPTCVTEGKYDEVVYCSICGEELSRKTVTVEALGHDWDEGVITKEATPSEDGEKLYTCKHDASHTKTEAVKFGTDSGTWGNVTWSVNNEGILTISGTGNMPTGEIGWGKYKADIHTVVIESGITNIGDNVFSAHSNVTNVTIPDSVQSIGYGAFSGCGSLTSITIPESITSINNYAFRNTGLTEIHFLGGPPTVGNYAFSGVTADAYYPLLQGWSSGNMKGYGGALTWKPYFTPVSGNCGDNLTWVFDGLNGVLTISGSGDMWKYNEEDAPWVPYASLITTVVIQPGATSIGAQAFCECGNLTTAQIANTVQRIETRAFENCSQLRDINIPSSATRIDGMAFAKCTGLTELTIPGSVQTLGYDVFRECTALRKVTLGEGIPVIFESMFSGCSSLQEVNIPSSVTEIGNYAFYNCSGLTAITIPGSVQEMGTTIFRGCTSLQSVTLESGVPAIGNGAFIECSSLREISIPSSVTSIGDHAFSKCTSLTELTIPGSVKTMGEAICTDCTGLQKVTIESGVPVIGKGAFIDCTNLREISIPSTVNSISDAAFSGCTSLSELTIPGSVKTIGTGICNGCTGLKKLTLSEGVTSIGDLAFFRCSGLTELTIPGSMQTFGTQIFYGCTGLRKVTVSEGVTKVGDYMFAVCSDLQEVSLPGTLKSIGEYAFNLCSALPTITIPQGVTSIGPYAFSACSGMLKATIKGEIGTLSEAAFAECTVLETVNFSGGVQIIGRNAFVNCQSLKNVQLPAGLTDIGEMAFAKCARLEKISLPDSLVTIDQLAFGECTRLSSIVIPARVSSLAKGAFYKCISLDVIRFQGVCPTIAGDCFASVTADAYYPTRAGWLPEHRLNYGGSLTWVAYDQDPVEEYVKRCYRLLMDREGDAGGVNYWVKELKSGKQGGASIVDQFISSKEFVSFGLSNRDTVKVIYRTMLTREPDAGGLAYWQSFMDDGMSPHYIVSGFSGAKEFKDLCSSYGIQPGRITLTQYRDKNNKVTQFVNRNYSYALERQGDANGLNYWCEKIIRKQQTPQQCAQNFVFSAECVNRNLSNQEFVEMLYHLYMGRDADQGGLNHWLGQLNKGMSRQAVANSFANSKEFKQIVASYGL
ncbi:MAG: leucine-rich repeat protein, partial [Oscillospiraceae bacterium]|nr:leucine-rich repeat protein [Oscillospiraceae bacterium]